MADIGHPTPPLHYSDPIRGLEEIAIAVQRIMRGETNNAGSVTLTANVASTAVTDQRVGVNSVIVFAPRTANAAAEIGAGTMYIDTADIGDGTFTITHANNAQADRTFDYLIGG